jgi:hypothetical protein
MSIDTPNGILDITNAIVRVSKLEFQQATGFDTVLNNIARNTILLDDSSTYETATTYHNWALKLPNAWVFEADVFLASGTSGGGDHTFNLNFYNNVNTAITNGYTLGLNDTTLTLSYDGTQLDTVTLPSTLNTDSWRKLFVLFERDTFAVAIDGEAVYSFTDSVLRPRVYDNNSGYVVFYHEAGVARKIKNLKFVNGDKWIRESGSSNIAYIGGSVGIGTHAPASTLDVHGTANVGALTVTTVAGDGSALSGIQSSNVSDFASNVTRITNLESSDMTIGGEKTFSSNLEVGTANLFVDTTTSRVGVNTSSPAYTLDVHGTANVGVLSATLPLATVASNLVTYDTATGQLLDSNGLVSNKLSIVSEQPPAALTGDSTVVDGHGRYKVTSSNVVGSNYDYNIFSKNETDTWISLTDTFNVDGTYAGSESLGGVSGEWVKLEMPYKTTLRHFTLRHDIDNTTLGQRRQFPVDFKIVASNDDTNWQTLNTTTGVSTPEASDPALTFVVNASASYKFYAIVVEKITSGASFNRCHIGELRLFTETFTVDAGKVNMTGASGLETGFTEHPVAAMTGYHTYVEGHGTYEASASSSFSTYYPWTVFDRDQSTRWSNNNDALYDQNTNILSSTLYPNIFTSTVGGERFHGHWVQLKMPYSIILSHSNVHPTYTLPYRGPKNGAILGSNDGENWYTLTQFSGKTYLDNTWTRIDVNATTPYQYFRMCITEINTGEFWGFADMQEWRLFAEKDVTKFENVHISGDLSSETLQTGYIKWPRKSLKANESEGYVASSSSNYSAGAQWQPWHAFEDKSQYNGNNPAWLAKVYTFDQSTGAPDTSNCATFDNTSCEWIQITQPEAIQLSSFHFKSRGLSETPKSGSMYGSNDDFATYDKIASFSGNTQQSAKYEVQSANRYKSFRLVISEIIGYWYPSIDELQLFEAATGVGGAPTSAKLQVHGSLGLAKGSSLYAGDSVVAEFPKHDRPLTKYPEVAMTAASTAGYVANASSFYNFSSYPAHEIFNGVYGTELDMWVSSLYTYNVADGTVDTSNVATFQGISGEYVTLNLPKKISLKKVRLHSRNNSGASNPPNKGRIFGSNGDSIWKQLTTYDDLNMSHNDYRTIQVNATEYYKNYTFLIEEITIFGTSTYACIAELELYGHEEGDESVDVVHRSVPNKPGQQHLEVYWDANDSNSYSFADSSNVYDLSGSGVKGTITGNNGFDAEYNAWVFDGSGDYIESTLPSTFVDDQVHTVSLWFKRASNHDGTLFSIAPTSGETSSDSKVIQIRTNDSSGYTLSYIFWSNDLQYNPTIVDDTWYHLCGTYTGGGGTKDKKLLYLNGSLIEPTQENGTVTNVLDIDASSKIRLGSRINHASINYLDGSIANFRLFSKTLNADQVRELYEYDAPRFGHRQNLVSLHKGNLGVGVAHPTSRFEVAGADGLQEYPPRGMTGYETYMEGHGVFRASASTVRNQTLTNAGNAAWHAFDSEAINTYWININDDDDYKYAGTSNTYSGISQLSPETPLGEYITLECPYKIIPQMVGFKPYDNLNHQPLNAVVYGSNDGYTWTFISSLQNMSGYSTSYIKTFSLNNTSKEGYRYVSFITTQVTGTSPYLRFFTYRIYGTPAPSSLEDGHLTLGKTLTLPRVSGHAAGAETPRAESLVVHYDTTVDSVVSGTTVVDISGEGNNGTVNGTYNYSSSDRALLCGGTSSDYISTSGVATTSDFVHSISVWAKVNSIGTDYIASIGTAGGQSGSRQSSTLYFTSSGFQYVFYGADMTIPFSVNTNTWYHIVAVRSSGGTFPTTQKLYINGVDYSGGASWTDTTSTTLSLPSISTVYFGRPLWANETFDGSISNFKLYNVALTADEVAAEYALGRTGKSLNITDTAVCLGGTVPRAQLDVRGKIYANGSQSWPIPIASFSNVTPDNTGSAYYTRNIGSIWVYYNTLNFNNDTETIGSPATNSREITLNRKGLYEFHTGSSLSLQGSTASHIGHSIRHISGGVIERYLTDGYEVTQSDYNTVKLVERTQYIKVTEAPVVVGYFLQPTSNRSDRYKEYAYGSSFPIHTVTVKYLG